MARRKKSHSRAAEGEIPAWIWVLSGGVVVGAAYLLLRPRAAHASIALPGGTGAVPTTPISVPGVQAPLTTAVTQDAAFLSRYPDRSTAGERRNVVTVMQRQLVSLGFPVGSHGVDGVEGTDTLGAERDFITRYGMRASLLGDDAADRRELATQIDARYRAARGVA